jgi:hypothetical protein
VIGFLNICRNVTAKPLRLENGCGLIDRPPVDEGEGV